MLTMSVSSPTLNANDGDGVDAWSGCYVPATWGPLLHADVPSRPSALVSLLLIEFPHRTTVFCFCAVVFWEARVCPGRDGRCVWYASPSQRGLCGLMWCLCRRGPGLCAVELNRGAPWSAGWGEEAAEAPEKGCCCTGVGGKTALGAARLCFLTLARRLSPAVAAWRPCPGPRSA